LLQQYGLPAGNLGLVGPTFAVEPTHFTLSGWLGIQ
jgi:hypothetical protein